MHPPTDELLLEQARKGNQQAFAEVVRRHQGTVYSLCYRMLGDAIEAEDLAQEAFLNLYRSLDKFRPGGQLRPWLHKIAANVCLDALRKRRGPTLPLDEIDADLDQPRVHSLDELPEEAYASRERRLDVQKALLRLPGDYRVVLVLRDAAGNQYPMQLAMYGTGGSPEENHVSGTLTFAGLPAGTLAVDLSVPVEFVVPEAVASEAGLQLTDSWQAHLVLAPPSESGLPLAKPQTTAASVNGVTLRVAASAEEGGRTVLLVESDVPGPARVGSLAANGSDFDQTLVLSDARGRTYKRLEPMDYGSAGNQELRQTLYFEGPAPFAGDLTLRVAAVQVVEDGQASVTIPLAGHQPGETWALNREVTLGGRKVLLKLARLVHEQSADWLYVDVDLGSAVDGRLLSTFSVGGRGSWMSGNDALEGRQMSYFGVELPAGQREVTLQLASPSFTVEGPWDVTIPAGGK